MTGNKKLGIGIVGLGSSKFMQIPALASFPNAEMIAGADPIKSNRDWVKEHYKIKRLYSDIDELLEDKEVDVVVIATMTYMHREHVIKAAKIKKHIMCEKPMAPIIADCDAMIKACQENDVILMINYNKRFVECFKLAKDMIDEGVLGEIYEIDVCWTQSEHGRKMDSRGSLENLGGVYQDHGSHVIDLCRWWVGEVADVRGECLVGVLNSERCVDDLAAAFIRHQNGTIVTHHINLCDHRPNHEMYTISGNKATLTIGEDILGTQMRYFSVEPYKMLLYRNGKSVEDVTPHPYRGSEDYRWNIDCMKNELFSFTRSMNHFIDCVLNGKRPLIDGQCGRKTIEVVQSVYYSAWKHETVTLPLKETPDLAKVLMEIKASKENIARRD